MPVRSLTSSVLKWPDASRVESALERWVAEVLSQRDDVVRIGCFGSYARGDWGVGSDLELVVVVERSDLPFERRSARWDTSRLPVPADLLVYTEAEWARLSSERPFHQALLRQARWLYSRDRGTAGDKPAVEP